MVFLVHFEDLKVSNSTFNYHFFLDIVLLKKMTNHADFTRSHNRLLENLVTYPSCVQIYSPKLYVHVTLLCALENSPLYSIMCMYINLN